MSAGPMGRQEINALEEQESRNQLNTSVGSSRLVE